MADPQPYQISYSFAGFQANSPSTPLPAQVLDIELLNIQSAISGLVTSVTDVRRSDGALKNEIVTLDALHPSVRTAALSPVSDWEASTAYGVGQVVIQDGSLWSAAEAHTSGLSFATDEGNGLWEELAELPTGPQGPAATIAIGTVTTGAPGSDAEVTNVGTSTAAVLDITIPEGEQGETGDTGPAAWAAPVAWQTATAYTETAPRSVVVQGGETYACLISHTSGTFSTDIANGNWIKVAAKGADGLGTGDVTTTGSVTALRLARYADTTGDVLEDAGVATSTDGTLASNSDAKVPTEKAVKTYADSIRTAILNGVSSAYDTLAEIATWIGTTGTAALKNTGTSGNNVPLLDGTNQWSAPQRADKTALTHNTGANFSTKQNFTATVNGSAFTIANPSNAPNDGQIIKIFVSFTTTHGLSFGNKFKTTGYTPSATSGKKDVCIFEYDSSADLYYLIGFRTDVGT